MARGLRLFGHPVHAMLTDIPIGLMGTSLIWDIAGVWRQEPVWWAISFWSIALGLCSAVAAAASGLWDYIAIGQDSPAIKTATNHMLIMLTAVSLYGASLLVRAGPAPPLDSARTATFVLEGLGLALLTVGGWMGGHLVFHHGIGSDR